MIISFANSSSHRKQREVKKSSVFDTHCSSFELKFLFLPSPAFILIPKTARRLSHPARDATERLQAKIGVVCDGRPGKLDESVQELPLEVGKGVMGGENTTFGMACQ